MPERTNYDSLRDFIAHLEFAGELVRIKEKVSPFLEITEIADRVSKSPHGGKALLFENVEGSSMPVLINAFGSKKRMAMALGTGDLESIAADIEKLVHIKPPDSFSDKLAMLPQLLRFTKFPPAMVSARQAPCQDVVLTGADIDLRLMPILHCWPEDGGRFITMPAVFTKSPDGARNVGMYRLQMFNRMTTGMHWHIHKDGASNFHEHARAGRKRMEVAVAIGADPAVVFAATAPLPHGVDEMLLAGFIREKPVKLVKCHTVDLEVPAEAEIVLEGYVDIKERRVEGPFGDHTGYYSLADEYPVFHVTAMTHRKAPIYLTTIVGKPPMEDCYMGKATERIFLPLLKTINPEVVDYSLPWEGVFHNCVIVAMKKRYPMQARRLMSALWGAGQMSFAKMILVVDEKMNVQDHKAMARVMLDNLSIPDGLIHSEGVLDALDHSAPLPLCGAKLGIDATSPMEGEPKSLSTAQTPAKADFDQALIWLAGAEEVGSFSVPFMDVKNPLLILSVKKREAGDAFRIARKVAEVDKKGGFRIILAVDEHVDAADYSTALWKFFNNCDPKRDIQHSDGRLFIDATAKLPEEGHGREWPKELVMDSGTKARVDEIWPRLGLEE
ncbi:MAG: menaquinone biosynthesis decarboxylase [Nitrospinota bacterium]|nr:menaquinone biosynthesis decarboxylase [Nitrospinota bacterium]